MQVLNEEIYGLTFVILIPAQMWLVTIHILCNLIYDTLSSFFTQSLIQQIFIECLLCAMTILETRIPAVNQSSCSHGSFFHSGRHISEKTT